MKEFLTLKHFFLQHKGRYIWGIVFLLIVDTLQLVTPRLLGLFTDALLAAPVDRAHLYRYIYAILAAAGGIALFRYFWRLYLIGTARLLEKHLRELLFNHLQRLSPRFYLRHKTGELMAHLTNDITAVRATLGFNIVMLVDAVILTAVALTMMFTTVDARLTMLAFIPMPFLALGSKKLGRGVYSRFMKVQESFGGLTNTVQENISGARLVQAFSVQESEKIRFLRSSEEYMHHNFHLYRLWGLYDPLIYSCAVISFVLVLLYGGGMVMEGSITIGDFVAFNGYLGLMVWPMLALGWVINITQRGRASMERINRLLEESPEVVDHPQALKLGRADLQGDIELERLSFSYYKDSRPVLDNISASFPGGKITALTGRTGSGKTTLVHLLLRFFEPQGGSIFVNGHPLERVPLKLWREIVSYVPQDNYVFSTTIAENIAFALPGPADGNMPDIKRAASLAALDAEIESMPSGYDTMVGERGVTLSGGQQQRLALARALISKPQFLILDDALSSVDISTEEKIMSNLQEIETTIVIISHRLGALRRAHRILVLDSGRLVEEGDHAGLLEQKGYYYNLCRNQLWEDIFP